MLAELGTHPERLQRVAGNVGFGPVQSVTLQAQKQALAHVVRPTRDRYWLGPGGHTGLRACPAGSEVGRVPSGMQSGGFN
jgi:hypothetical protein